MTSWYQSLSRTLEVDQFTIKGETQVPELLGFNKPFSSLECTFKCTTAYFRWVEYWQNGKCWKSVSLYIPVTVSLREVVFVCSIYFFELNLIMKFGQSRCWNFFCLSSSKLPWNLCYLNYPRCSGDCDSWIMFIMHWTSKQSNFGTTRTGIHLHLHLR